MCYNENREILDFGESALSVLVKNIEEEAAYHSGLFLFYKLITYIQE